MKENEENEDADKKKWKEGDFRGHKTAHRAMFRKAFDLIYLEDIEEESLYVYLKKEKIVGCIMFSEKKDPLYNTVNWLTPDNKNLYIHRLAVHPKSQRQGIARQLMDFAEDFGEKKRMESIRLDTFSQNPRNIRFYKARGYLNLGDVYFENQSEDPFHCFEKLIKRI